MRNFADNIKRDLNKKSLDGFPTFPKKKYIGNTSAKFLDGRMAEL
jgi:hypothetical protein